MRIQSVKFRFKFPFYGHRLNNVTIATGGFCYVGEYAHSWLAATQYIAPLMANFETYSANSSIMYGDDGEKMIIEWSRVSLRDNKQAGEFTFQAHLFKSGDIWFVYKDVGSFSNALLYFLIIDPTHNSDPNRGPEHQ